MLESPERGVVLQKAVGPRRIYRASETSGASVFRLAKVSNC
jgi:hypothetical protein